MNGSELENEVKFGLENLEKIYLTISSFAQKEKEVDERLKVSALTYECLGYYNAIEHLIIRIIKYLRIEIPSGPFSHRDILKLFEALINERSLNAGTDIVKIIETLMAFRYVATKIYSFLIDWNKLKFVIRNIEENHGKIKHLILDVLEAMK